MRIQHYFTAFLFLILCCTVEICFGTTPATNNSAVIPHDDPAEQREFQNVYQDIKNPTINSGTASTFTITSLSVSTITSSPIFTNTIQDFMTGNQNRLFLHEIGSNEDAWIETYVGANNGLLLGINRNPVSGTFTQTGQTASSIELISANGAGSVVIKSTNTNNFAPGIVATFADSGVSIKGTTSNTDASAGNVGEYVSCSGSNTNAPTSTQYGDFCSMSLTPGDWDVELNGFWSTGGAAITSWDVGISATSGNSGTGLTYGQNATSSEASTIRLVSLARWRIKLASTTTQFFKYKSQYTGGPPNLTGIMSARRPQ